MAIGIGTALLLSGGLQLAGSYLGSKAAGQAASAQGRAAALGIDEQRRQFDITQQNYQQQQEMLSPYREAGIEALGQEQALMGMLGPQAQQQAIAALQQSPETQFAQQQAERSLTRNAAALGGIGGGNIRRDLAMLGGRFGGATVQNQLSRLGSMRGAGMAALGQQGQMTGALGQLGQMTSGNISNLMAQQGQAQAGGILGRQAAIGQGLQNIGGLATTYALLGGNKPVVPVAGVQ